jgi:hypothetical protein
MKASSSTTPSSSSSKSVSKPMPLINLPEPIYSTTPGTWAYDTMSRRVGNLAAHLRGQRRVLRVVVAPVSRSIISFKCTELQNAEPRVDAFGRACT